MKKYPKFLIALLRNWKINNSKGEFFFGNDWYPLVFFYLIFFKIVFIK